MIKNGKFVRYTPGVHKLMYHVDHIKAICNNIPIAPIHVSIWPTIKCQLKCPYCCCKNIKEKNQELTLNEYRNLIQVLSDYGTKAIEFSGGGEPLLWEPLPEAISYTYIKNIKLSLITNGIALKNIPNNIYSNFSWIRISLQSFRHAESIDFDYVKNLTNVSASYIFYEKNNTDELKKLWNFAKKRNIIIRIAAKQPCSEDLDNFIENEVSKYGYPLFYSKKEKGKPHGCYMAWVRAAVDWKGNFLPCPATQVTPEYEGYISNNFVLCHISELREWIKRNPPHDLGYRCSYCNCGKEHNDFIFNLLQGNKDVEFV